jgi:hypothetical protein
MPTYEIFNVFTSVLFSIVVSGISFANNSSIQENSLSQNTPTDNRRKIRLGFTAPSTMHRQLLLTEDANATPGIDWGYDGAYYETEYDDMYWLIEGQLFTIQGTNNLDEFSNFKLGFHTNDSGMNTIGIDALENISEDFKLYIYDNELDAYHNLRDGEYEFYADAGEHLDRFDLVFNNPEESSLSIEDNELDSFKIYYNSGSNTLVLNNVSNATLKGLSIYNMAGQLVQNYTLNEGLRRQEIQFNSQPTSGTYIVLINTEQGTTSKKVVLH